MSVTILSGTSESGGGEWDTLPLYAWSYDVSFEEETGWYFAFYTFTQGATTHTLTIPVSNWEPPLESRLAEFGVREAMRLSEQDTPTIQDLMATLATAPLDLED